METKYIKFLDTLTDECISIMHKSSIDGTSDDKLFGISVDQELKDFNIFCILEKGHNIYNTIFKLMNTKQKMNIKIFNSTNSNSEEKICVISNVNYHAFNDNDTLDIDFEIVKEPKKNVRKSWDNYFMDMAFATSERSTCERLHVGAVVVKNNRVKATGYNGSPRGLEHCDESGCYMIDNHCVRTIHAELNALLECSPEEREGATLYVTDRPCPECQKIIITCGIKRVVYSRHYEPKTDWFESTDILVERLNNEQNSCILV